MIKKNKFKLIISSIVILLPMLFGIFGAKFLSEEIIVHWGIDSSADGFAGATSFFIIMPIVLLVIHWLCMILSAFLNKNNEQNKKLTEITFWIIPVISLASSGIVFATSLGFTANIFAFVLILLGAMFIIIGNYMPKTTRNISMGIKIKWALMNDENWNATHRFAAKVYVIIGILCFLAIILPENIIPFVFLAIILASVVLPTVYSYCFYKKQLADGVENIDDGDKVYESFGKNKKQIKIITAILLSIVAVIVCILMFTGSVSTTLSNDSISIKASFWSDLTLSYDDIDSIEYHEDGVSGQRINGVGSAKLLLGTFKNDEFGVYTRYTYNNDTPCIVLKVDKRIIVINTESKETTDEIFKQLSSKISK